MDGHEEEVRRVSVPALSWLRTIAIQIEEDGRLGREFDASELAELCATPLFGAEHAVSHPSPQGIRVKLKI
jgi:hypothetical protein